MSVEELLTCDDFNESIKQEFVLVDFYAEWCGPCKSIGPKVIELAKEYPSVKFYKVDVDELSDISDKYDVKSLPTFIAFENGLMFDSFTGANYEKLKKLIDDLIDV
jgi:thioredoxin 1